MRFLGMLTLGAAFLISCNSEAPAKRGNPDVIEAAAQVGSSKTLVAALQAAGLVETLKEKGPYTLFAPTDEAFAKLPAGTLEALLKDVPRLRAVLLYHVVPRDIRSGQAAGLGTARTLEGSDLAMAAGDVALRINQAAVTKADLECSNGVIHVIDQVLLPPRPVPPAAADAPRATLVVRVSSITDAKGTLRYLVFKSDPGFPRDSRKALTGGSQKVDSTSDLTVRIPDLPSGEYAVSVFQDLDDNGTLDTNFFGIPREPVGASNDPKSRTGPPRYEDAKFSVSAPETLILIHLVHP